MAWKNLVANQLVLDVGCGTGRQCIQMAKHKIYSIGIDISEEMLKVAKKKNDRLNLSEYVDLIVADGEKPPFKNNIFDACVFYGTLHHLSNPKLALHNSAKKIKKMGLIYTLDPNKSPLRPIFDFIMKIWKLYSDTHIIFATISKQQLDEWTRNAKLKGKIHFSTYLPPHPLYLLNYKFNRVIP